MLKQCLENESLINEGRFKSDYFLPIPTFIYVTTYFRINMIIMYK